MKYISIGSDAIHQTYSNMPSWQEQNPTHEEFVHNRQEESAIVFFLHAIPPQARHALGQEQAASRSSPRLSDHLNIPASGPFVLHTLFNTYNATRFRFAIVWSEATPISICGRAVLVDFSHMFLPRSSSNSFSILLQDFLAFHCHHDMPNAVFIGCQ